MMHERSAWAFTMTVHAPHCPSPQPNFGPRNSRSSLSAYRSGVAGSRSSVWLSPLTFRWMVLIVLSCDRIRSIHMPTRYRAEQVGSLLRPASLLAARAAHTDDL